MKIRTFAAAAAAASLAVAPIAVQAAPSVERSAAGAEQESEINAFGGPVYLLIIAAAAVGLYLLVDDGDDDPVSA